MAENPSPHPQPPTRPTIRILRVRQVAEKTGLSRAYIYKLERQGDFPKRRKLCAASVGWLEHEVDDWCLSRPAAM